MAEISADISAKKRPFWIEPLTAYSRVLLCPEETSRKALIAVRLIYLFLPSDYITITDLEY
jgi:hypothetical protein